MYNLISSALSVLAGVAAGLTVHELSDQELASWFAGACVYFICESVAYATIEITKAINE